MTPIDPYLTPKEMHDLTGSRVFRCQIRALKAEGWAFFVNDKGRPKVLRTYHDARMAGESTTKTKPKKEFNWSKAA